MTHISNDLIEAYKGYYEDELQEDFVNRPDGAGNFTTTYQEWLDKEVRQLISEATPKRRLEVYLEWNGIVGYASRIYEIATGEL